MVTSAQWLKRTVFGVRFYHPKAYHISPNTLDGIKQSLLDAFIKVSQHLCVQGTGLPTDDLVIV
jgi:hypothetical protein